MITAKQKRGFLEDGYLVFKELVPRTLVEEIRKEVQTLSEKETGVLYPNDNEGWDFDSLQPQFWEMIQRVVKLPNVRESIQDLIGLSNQLLLSAYGLVRSDRGKIFWHQDASDFNELIVEKYKSTNGLTDINVRLVPPALLGNFVGVLIYLQDTSDSLSPMRVIPGSHLWNSPPNNPHANSLPGEVRFPLPAGSAVFFDTNIWHTVDRNVSTIDSWTLNLFFITTNIESLVETC
jgi:ectoine hydroxylase-related dioxygenase (phytanoyl-CoA dioxygenase family)